MKINSVKSRSPQESAALHKLTLILQHGKCVNKWRKLQQKSKQRLNILREWQTTEKSYIDDLKIIQNGIQKPLVQSQIISEAEDKVIFPNIKAMVQLSDKMHNCIQLFVEKWDPHRTMIGQSLMHFHKFFMIYREYCNNFMKALQILKALKNNPEYLKISSKLKMDCESYTIKPVQRPPKYQLLLREYYKALPVSHKDYNFVGKTITKYEQVNEMNNQSMDKQIRNETMIKLERLFGGIISDRMGREYLKEFNATCLDFRCKVYAFNDMLLIVRKTKDAKTDEVYKRLELNQTSFAARKQHLKHFKNMVFVCGSSDSVHLSFDIQGDADYFYEQIIRILSIVQNSEDHKFLRFNDFESRRKNNAKFTVCSWEKQNTLNMHYMPKIRIVVEGTGKPKNEPVFLVVFQISHPFHISQSLLIPLNTVLQIQEYLVNRYKDANLPRIDERPEHISYLQASKVKSTIIEYYSFMIEQSLNFVYRNKCFYNEWKHISQLIGLHNAFHQFATSEKFNCSCERCTNLQEGGSAQFYEKLIQQIKQSRQAISEQHFDILSKVDKSYSGSRLSETNPDLKVLPPTKDSSHSVVPTNGDTCPTYLFKISDELRKTNKANINFNQRMLCLESEMGNFNCSLLRNDSPSLQKAITIRIQLLTVDQEYIEVVLKQDRTVRDIIEEFGSKNSVSNVYDWGLFILEEDEFIPIGNDEKILQFIGKLGVEIEQMQLEKAQQSFGISSILGDFKKWGEQMLCAKKVRLFLKKSLYFQPEFELGWCRVNKERYHFLINEQFGRIKMGEIQLHWQQLITICSFYLLINELENIKHSINQIFVGNIKHLLQKKDRFLVDDEQFKRTLGEEVKKNFHQLSDLLTQRNGIEFIYIRILEVFKQNNEWLTRYFKVLDYNNSGDRECLLGVNYETLMIVRAKNRKIELSIPLLRLNYRITTFSIFIQEEGAEYRFDGRYLWKIKELVEIYRAYRRLFLDS